MIPVSLLPHPSCRKPITLVTYTNEVFQEYKTVCFTDGRKWNGKVGLACLIYEEEKLVVEVQSILYYLDYDIYFSYVRGHSGNLGNDRGDQLAKEATCQDMNLLMSVSLSHWKHVVWERTASSWNTEFLASPKALWTKTQCNRSLRKTCTLGFRLQEYDIDITYKSGRKHSGADSISRNSLPEALAEHFDEIPSLAATADYKKEQMKDKHLKFIIKTLKNVDGYQVSNKK
ncbi:retrovirus-related Pol polyprotein from transposon 17.6 [Trichonephila clavipes]|nr:retrovirus-related Pol polyprotein from transposon 17.6 [Trichonephila clavipes]